MAALTMINSLIAGIITFLSIVKAIDNKIDSRYFQFRKSIDGNIIDEMKKFWDGKCDNTSTSTNCPSNVNGACVKNINKEKLFMKMFYRIIDNNQRFDTSKELMFVYFNYYWVLMIILFLSFTYIPFTLVTFFIQSYILPNLLDGYMRLWCFVCIIFVILVPLVLPLARKKQILRYIFIISYLAS
nr:hypothetical protein [Candidatus Sigynarchaeota archaeon]